MAKGDKYIGLTRYLENCDKEELTLSFKQIKSIIGDSLPPSANVHREFWSIQHHIQ